MIPRILARLEEGRQEFTWKELCYGLLPRATILRWRARAQAGESVVGKPGPKKRKPLDLSALRTAIQQLDHGRRRTDGTIQLQALFSDCVSRRRFQELVAEERQAQSQEITRIQWLVPGAAWSIDTTEYQKTKITPLRDLASKYQLPAPLVGAREDGRAIAAYLDLMFRKYGPPLFLKRDGGSPLNCAEVDQVLSDHHVLPLNSPPGYPRYNGSMERSMQDLKRALDQQQPGSLPTVSDMQVELVTHQLNHRRLRSLSRLTPCQVFHDPARRMQLHGASRQKIFREVFAEFWYRLDMLPHPNPHLVRATWRSVVESWLRRQGWITVSTKTRNAVSTDSGPFCSHN